MAKKTTTEPEPPDVPNEPTLPLPRLKRKGHEQFDPIEVEKYIHSWYDTRYNTMKGVVEFRHAKTREPFVLLEDTEVNSMVRKLYYVDQNIPSSMLHLILYSDFSPKYNAIKDYFKHLPKWDGVTDWIGQLAATMKTTRDDYWGFCFLKWFVSFAAGMLIPDVINHTAIVLVGGQGVGKSTWMRRLLPKKLKNFYTSSLIRADNKDTAIDLAECALIIMDDMEGLTVKDFFSYKELITRPSVHVRRPYARNSVDLERIASFIASLNYDNLLTDPTGSRRFLCFNVIDVDSRHKVDLDCCMAQAIALYEQGFQHYFSLEEIMALNEHNEDFKFKSIEEELIDTWLRPVTVQEFKNKDKFMKDKNIQLMNAGQIAAKLLEKMRFSVTDGSLSKIGKVMAAQGFVRVKKKKRWYYMVRILDAATVDEDNRHLIDPDAEQKENDQIIGLEEDLNGGPVDDLPF